MVVSIRCVCEGGGDWCVICGLGRFVCDCASTWHIHSGILKETGIFLMQTELFIFY